MNALPSPKPTCRGRLVLRFVALFLASAVLVAAYRFTRPPELVWWSSPDTAPTGARVRVLIPQSWELESKEDQILDDKGSCQYIFILSPGDRRPTLVRRFFPQTPEGAFAIVQMGHATQFQWPNDSGISTELSERAMLASTRSLSRRASHDFASITYARSNRSAFNRTYKQICNSLKIE